MDHTCLDCLLMNNNSMIFHAICRFRNISNLAPSSFLLFLKMFVYFMNKIFQCFFSSAKKLFSGSIWFWKKKKPKDKQQKKNICLNNNNFNIFFYGQHSDTHVVYNFFLFFFGTFGNEPLVPHNVNKNC